MLGVERWMLDVGRWALDVHSLSLRRGGTPSPYLASRIDEMPYCGNALLPY
jgi:hypothetical protein